MNFVILAPRLQHVKYTCDDQGKKYLSYCPTVFYNYGAGETNRVSVHII